MKLTKAIDILQDECCVPNSEFQKPKYQAIALGIEALKRVRDNPIVANHFFRALLPGETPETAPTRSLHHIKAVLENPLGKEPKG